LFQASSAICTFDALTPVEGRQSVVASMHGFSCKVIELTVVALITRRGRNLLFREDHHAIALWDLLPVDVH
jgi:hypothetical protein